MATTKEVSFHIGRKISDGDFGSFDVHIGEVAVVGKGQTFDEAFEEVRERVQAAYDEEVGYLRKLIARLKKKRRERDND